jgi:putative intracellular protease/amidase
VGEKLQGKKVAFVGTDGVDQEAVVDAGFVTSLKPDDPPAFGAKVVEEICEGRHDERPLQTADAG